MKILIIAALTLDLGLDFLCDATKNEPGEKSPFHLQEHMVCKRKSKAKLDTFFLMPLSCVSHVLIQQITFS